MLPGTGKAVLSNFELNLALTDAALLTAVPVLTTVLTAVPVLTAVLVLTA